MSEAERQAIKREMEACKTIAMEHGRAVLIPVALLDSWYWLLLTEEERAEAKRMEGKI